MEWHYIAIAVLFSAGVLGWGLWFREKRDSEKWWVRRIEEKNDIQGKIASLQTENGKLQAYESFYHNWQHAPVLQDTIDRLRTEMDRVKSENTLLKEALTNIEEVENAEPSEELEEIELEQLVEVVDPKLLRWPWERVDIESKRLERAAELVPDKLSTGSELAAEYISSSTGEVYRATLQSCSCVDFSKNLHKKKPCKHMLSLALCLNIIDPDGELVDSSAGNDDGNDQNAVIAIAGKKFAFCGRMKTITQGQAASEVEKHGGVRTSASNADILIVGDHPPMGKVLAAAKVGAKMISEEEFIALLTE